MSGGHPRDGRRFSLRRLDTCDSVGAMNVIFHTLFCCGVCAGILEAQHSDHAPQLAPRGDSISVMATALSTTGTPAIFGRARTEALVTQPMLMFRASRARSAWQLAAMLNAELWTMPGGEPVAGIWGEGFIDRRHPHTLLHELMLTRSQTLGAIRVSLSAGKGIVPFGTDDPMVRPLTKYPSNHHLAQILERIQLIAAVRFSTWAAVEAAIFNGDEPTSPTSRPEWSRFGDSRSVRASFWIDPAVEVQASLASVRSPEFPGALGLDQQKSSASVRWSPARRFLRYALVEWARNEDSYRGRSIIDYGSALGEAQFAHKAWSVSLRAEQTTRPEEERLLNPFRTELPPTDLTIKGLTRWQLFSGQLAHELPAVVHIRTSAFLEATHARSHPLLSPVLLDPKDVIGRAAAWHVSFGLRMGIGTMPARVGRYGASAGGPRTDVMLGMQHDH